MSLHMLKDPINNPKNANMFMNLLGDKDCFRIKP